MLARVEFLGIITEDGKKKGLRDHIDIHVGKLAEAEIILKSWLKQGVGLRGDSGIFHPLVNKWGEIVIKSVKEAPKE